MERGLSKILASAVQTEAVVTCAFCGEKHRISEKTFFVFYGDMSEGLEGDLLRDHIDAKGKVVGSTVFCKKHKPVMDFALMFMRVSTHVEFSSEVPQGIPEEEETR